VSCIPAIIRQDRGEFNKRDEALTLPWVISLVLLIPAIVGIFAKLRLPLRDDSLKQWDRGLGLSVPAIVSWCAAHPTLNSILNHSYNLLFLLLPLAVILPAIIGAKKTAQRFLLSNTIAFIVSVPIFTMLPAVGPWYGYHFAGSTSQNAVQASILALHSGSTEGAIGIVCFPSFHVIWALLSAVALWDIKPIRYPSAILAALIIISTVTTGWHYVCDVFGGLAISALSTYCAVAVCSAGAKNPAFVPMREGI
jgi:membrane-associated phospholipid phosphatase